MVGVRLMHDWHNLKLMLFMRLSKTRTKAMKKLLGSSPQGAKPNLWPLSTVTGMIMALPLQRYNKEEHLSLLSSLSTIKIL